MTKRDAVEEAVSAVGIATILGLYIFWLSHIG